MEYIHTALLLHKAGKKIDGHSVKKVLEAAGITPDEARIKALVASLDGVDIDEAIKKASLPVAQPQSKEEKREEKKEEPKKIAEEEKKTEEKAAEGLSSLFG